MAVEIMTRATEEAGEAAERSTKSSDRGDLGG